MILQLRDLYFQAEGYLLGGGMVIVPIILISFVMWTLIINRVLFFRRLFRKNMSRVEAGRCVRHGEFPDQKQYRGITSLLVRRFLTKKTGHLAVDKHILDETVMHYVSSLDSYLAVIQVLASIAPLLGLLGTVTGMITTFNIIAGFGTGNARAMAGGISEALITTQSGLLVAIPGLYMSGFLKRRAEILKQRLSSVGLYLLNYI
ncbi:MAG: MotA/TolQ/ExbB proton channel family protein [Deltaproteobacteria bacterium]|mgnify:FL=1|nr:MotA/TolQ/ExbB proton channel family protein [Deltaproteobacteria bacterium]